MKEIHDIQKIYKDPHFCLPEHSDCAQEAESDNDQKQNPEISEHIFLKRQKIYRYGKMKFNRRANFHDFYPLNKGKSSTFHFLLYINVNKYSYILTLEMHINL